MGHALSRKRKRSSPEKATPASTAAEQPPSGAQSIIAAAEEVPKVEELAVEEVKTPKASLLTERQRRLVRETWKDDVVTLEALGTHCYQVLVKASFLRQTTLARNPEVLPISCKCQVVATIDFQNRHKFRIISTKLL